MSPKVTTPKKRRGRKPRTKPVDREALFCHFYIKQFPSHNGAEAARQAGYSPKGAAVKASQLLATPRIQARLDELLAPLRAAQARITERTLITKERLLEELAAMATLDLRRMYTEVNGELVRLPLQLWPDELAMALVGIENTQWGTRFKFGNKLEAIKLELEVHKILEGPPPSAESTIHIYLPDKQPLALGVTTASGTPPLLELHLPPKERNGHPAAPPPGPTVIDGSADPDDELG